MPNTLEDVVKAHRVEHAKREAAWMLELESRRRECVARACVDIAALRAKLAI